ncbi:MAG: MmcQ/YjbR family DNA-binding protein, partial [Pseudomonadota bacterium]|nr:MmcQ/YjbR family DNA-binding protein [Pseudomonadota bacterium]
RIRLVSSANQPKNISQAVREICLSLPATGEVTSHGSPDFRVDGKTFATYMINHHGAGHLALWLRMPTGSRSATPRATPTAFMYHLMSAPRVVGR